MPNGSTSCWPGTEPVQCSTGGVYAPFCAERVSLPSTPPELDSRMLSLGFLEGVDIERGTEWGTADAMATRRLMA